MTNWKKTPGRKTSDGTKERRKREGGQALKGPGNAYPVEFRMRVIREVVEGGVSAYRMSQVFGASVQTIERWVEAYKKRGIDGLVPKAPGKRAPEAERPQTAPKRDAVVGLREQHPEYGTSGCT